MPVWDNCPEPQQYPPTIPNAPLQLSASTHPHIPWQPNFTFHCSLVPASISTETILISLLSQHSWPHSEGVLTPWGRGPRPAAEALPEMQILPGRPTESESLGMGPSNWCFLFVCLFKKLKEEGRDREGETSIECLLNLPWPGIECTAFW